MSTRDVIVEHTPHLDAPLFIAGFEGWGNALNVSKGMLDFMIRAMEAVPFAYLRGDPFYRYDETRPQVNIEYGRLKEVAYPGGTFYAVPKDRCGRDLVLFACTEPHLQWHRFGRAVGGICSLTEAATVITLGSMFDDVLHTDVMVSAISNRDRTLSELGAHRVVPSNYSGPSAVHSVVQEEAAGAGREAVSLWCHCPYYLQGTTHFGLLSHLGSILAAWGRFRMDTSELDASWRDVNKQIQEIIDKNPELQQMVNDLRKAKVKGSWDSAKRHDNVIHLEEFLKPG